MAPLPHLQAPLAFLPPSAPGPQVLTLPQTPCPQGPLPVSAASFPSLLYQQFALSKVRLKISSFYSLSCLFSGVDDHRGQGGCSVGCLDCYLTLLCPKHPPPASTLHTSPCHPLSHTPSGHLSHTLCLNGSDLKNLTLKTFKNAFSSKNHCLILAPEVLCDLTTVH